MTPKGCHVRYVELNGRGGAEIRLSCDGVYSSRNVKARAVSFRGGHMSGAGRMDFVLSPAHAVCKKSGATIACHLVGDTSSASLRGARRRRRR